MTSTAYSFIQSLLGFKSVGATPSSADVPVKLATIDPAYLGSGNPKVTFDGESTLTIKTYVYMGSGKPRAGDRVVMLPVGRSYVIIGVIGSPAAESSVPVGTSLSGYWTAAPTGYLLEDGTVQTRTTYPALFAILGTTFNTGGETGTQFRLPDSRGRVQAGKAASGTFLTLGAKVGNETEALSIAQLPAHAHNVLRGASAQQHVEIAAPTGGAGTNRFVLADGTATLITGNTGTGTAHANIQPTIVALRCIKY